MTQEKEADKYFISVSLEGVQVMRHEVHVEEDPGAFPNATVSIDQLPASIRNLVVSEK